MVPGFCWAAATAASMLTSPAPCWSAGASTSVAVLVRICLTSAGVGDVAVVRVAVGLDDVGGGTGDDQGDDSLVPPNASVSVFGRAVAAVGLQAASPP